MISRKQLGVIKRYHDAFGLPHTYTHTPKIAGGTDAYNNKRVINGTPVEDKPCRYRASDALRREDQGKSTVYRPQLSLPSEDILAVGDLVSNITDPNENAGAVVLLEGPLEVESIVIDTSMGPVGFKVAYLKLGTTRA